MNMALIHSGTEYMIWCHLFQKQRSWRILGITVVETDEVTLNLLMSGSFKLAKSVERTYASSFKLTICKMGTTRKQSSVV